MKFSELPSKMQEQTFKEIVAHYEKAKELNPVECAKSYVECANFEIVDYSADEDGSDLRVEW